MNSKHRVALSKHFDTKKFLVMVAVGSLFILIPISHAIGGPKRLETVSATDCTACHGDQKLFDKPHVDMTGMMKKDCDSCHSQSAASLHGKLPLSHTHHLVGTSCTGCHGDARSAISQAACFSCHESPQKVAERTKTLNTNPHTSPHYGENLACDACHHVHKKSENFCLPCHSEFNFVVP